MTALPPPTYYFNGITFNSAFYPQTATTGNYVNYPTAQGALTIPSATITTTLGVSGLLTASGNLNTNSIDAIGNGISIGPSKNITLGALGTTNSIQIGASNRTVGISVGSVVIGADSITGLSNGTNFKICDTLVEGNISIGELQQGGKINIGTFSGRLATGEINIGNNSGATAIPINIGGSGSTTTINGNLSITGTFSPASVSSLIINTSSIDTPTTAYALEIGKTNATTSQSYAGALTTNDLNIALAQTTGIINIGTGSGRINTGGAAKGAINIGTGAGANAFGINIGGSGTTTTIGGTLAVTGAYSPASITTSGLITANGGITMGTIANGSATYNTYSTYTSTAITVTLSKVGQTHLLYRTSNSSAISDSTDTIFASATVTNAGIYTVCYQARYSATTSTSIVLGVQTWISVSAPTTISGQLGLNLVGYASPYLNLGDVGVSMTGSWTGLINASATVSIVGFVDYNTGSAITGVLLGGVSANYLSFTRIA